ncbi:MAG: class I SAM-dependent methyltransferase [Acidimicrobiales bacterium]
MVTRQGRVAFVRTIEGKGRQVLARLEPDRSPPHLTSRRLPIPSTASPYWIERINNFRAAAVPWMDADQRLDGSKVLELGCGGGASTAAMAEQGAEVVGIDLSEELQAEARTNLDAMGLDARLILRNARDVGDLLATEKFDRVIFFALLEHMTIEERIDALQTVWSGLGSGALMTIVETPNRLWPFDSHTSQLPFFNWLPYELAYRHSPASPRPGISEPYGDAELSDMEGFLRRGPGASYHEFDVAFGDHRNLPLVSSLQGWTRQSLLRRVAWRLSHGGRTERHLHSFAPTVDTAWFQPFLYLSFRKP